MELSRIKKLLTEERYNDKFANEEDYLSKETINRRRDQNLIDNITSTLYRLELENVKPSFDVKIRTGLHRRPYGLRIRRRFESSSPPPVAEVNSRRSRSRAPSTVRQLDGYEAGDAAILSKRRQAVADSISRAGSEVPDGSGPRLRERSQQPQPTHQRHSMYEGLDRTTPTSDTYYRLLHLQSAIGNYAALPRNWRQEFDHIAYRIANQSDDTYDTSASADLASSAAGMRASIQQQQQQQQPRTWNDVRESSAKWRRETSPLSSAVLERPYEDEWTKRRRHQTEVEELMKYMTPASSGEERFIENGTNGYTEDYDAGGEVETIFHNPFGGRRSQSQHRELHAFHQNASTSNEYNDLIKRLRL